MSFQHNPDNGTPPLPVGDQAALAGVPIDGLSTPNIANIAAELPLPPASMAPAPRKAAAASTSL